MADNPKTLDHLSRVLDIGEKITVKGMYDNVRNYMVFAAASVGVAIVTTVVLRNWPISDPYRWLFIAFMSSFVIILLILNVIQSFAMYRRIYTGLKDTLTSATANSHLLLRGVVRIVLLITYIVSIIMGMLSITAGTAAAVAESVGRVANIPLLSWLPAYE